MGQDMERRKETVILTSMDMELKTFGRSKNDGITTLPWLGVEILYREFMSDTDDIFVRNRSPPRK